MIPLALGIGSPELLVIVVLAVVLLGPEKIPDLAKKVGRIIRFLRGVANNATDQIKTELGPEYADLKPSDLKPSNLIQRIVGEDVTGGVETELLSLRDQLATMQTEMTRMQLQGGLAVHAKAAPPASQGAAVAADAASAGASGISTPSESSDSTDSANSANIASVSAAD